MKKAVLTTLALLATTVLLVLPFCAYFCLMPCEPWTDGNLLSVIGIFISYYTLLATVFVAFSIYWLQRRGERCEREVRTRRAKAAMLLELEDVLELYFFAPHDDRRNSACEGVKETLNSNAAELRDALTAEEFLLLKRMVNAIHKKDDQGISEFLRDWVRDAYLSEFRRYFSFAFDYVDFLDKRAFDLVNKLRGEKRAFKDVSAIEDNFGEVLLERNGAVIRLICGGVTYLDGELGFNGIFDKVVIVSGFGKTDGYEGQYEDGLYEGSGVEYGVDGARMREGRWRRGKLLSGTEYNLLIRVTQGKLIFKEDCPEDPYDATDDFEYENLELYGEHALSLSVLLRSRLMDDDIDAYYVVDMTVTETTEKPTNIRTLREFLRLNNPKLLAEITDER